MTQKAVQSQRSSAKTAPLSLDPNVLQSKHYSHSFTTVYVLPRPGSTRLFLWLTCSICTRGKCPKPFTHSELGLVSATIQMQNTSW